MNDQEEEKKKGAEKSGKKNTDLRFDGDEMDIPVEKTGREKQDEQARDDFHLSRDKSGPVNTNRNTQINQRLSKKNDTTEEKEQLLMFKDYMQGEARKNSEEQKEQPKKGKSIPIKERQSSKESNGSTKEQNNGTYQEEFEIPIHRKKRNPRSDFFSDGFFKNKDYEEEEQEEENRRLHMLDIFNYHDFPANLFGRKKTKTKNREKKFVIEFVDTYNDDFVKKNINNNLIFESIGVCKGISFLHINKNINVNCLGFKDNNAFYFYKMIPFDKIFSKDTMSKILSSKSASVGNEDTRQKSNRKGHQEKNDLERAHKNEESNPLWENYNMIKNYLFNKKKEKRTLYNDLYLSPYEKNLKSSICIGTHIYSKERAVKKCFGLLIEQNVYSADQPQDENSSVNKNLENLYFDFPFYRNQIIFKPVYYAYKNIPIVDHSFQSYFKNIQWEKMNKLKDAQFYYDVKNSFFNFSRDVYLTTKGAIRHFDSPKDFILQTANRMKDINFQMKKICERSFYIVHDSVMRLTRVSKSS
ncbi:conserved Plasmodium protein, unknown function [Plasmodium knowlesi strain H]|uniref:Uncharacterized protein n=3 Tax=Plasmodium knowlesi TaxID=5850 RepID=A0A5K1UPL3_PLAKH|nr:conserved Plasmodium protein, unknown function [Plasmodium knowlesi strain H]OTN65590.1 Uncharacterized protein PKNOH_S110095100 [Plasmodium knowlesi]CAA9989570.1 conserved Plasmodium protein, unknown function [Plasmodium knowlesi strain H]SBO22610.1 conserved Plasmodium protein, unknown function [Plasmodium knowlesi strain H]SBO23445.1 conserved Plasmodium protein, unknown function [Plasmodium knowlesi strain H]VVS79044.1 conserved Plasmodium protein, unknown function [Plasmodium knowlesi |eukprot:XP_002260295.1 hypothetical protein, conserved in Plasmodium species [Plasmodium knowlesi strain H]